MSWLVKLIVGLVAGRILFTLVVGAIGFFGIIYLMSLLGMGSVTTILGTITTFCATNFKIFINFIKHLF